MKIKFGAIVTDGRGKLGGHVFSKNAAGAFMRTKVTPTNPNTVNQTMARALFAAISAGWSALTSAQIAAWNAAVPDWQTTNIFGDLKKPTGKSLYQKLNNQAQSAGLSAVTDVPAKLALPDAPITAVPIGITATTLALTGVDTSASTQVVVWACPPVSDGTKNVETKMRQIYAAAGDAYSATAAYAAYVARFGAITTGSNVFVGVKYVVASGQASPLQTVKATISA